MHKNKKQENMKVKTSDSNSTANIKHFRKVALLMALYPLVVIGLGAATFYANYTDNPPVSSQQPTTSTVTPEVVVSNLDTPWSIQFAPDGKLYFTERPGRIRVYENGQLRVTPVATISGTETLSAEEGLQGLALHPNFASNGWLYAYYTYTSGANLRNRLVRYTLNPSTATVTSGPVTLIEDIPGYKFHNGGRIKFGPDGKLYVATGSATPDTVSQDKNSMGGKILRVNDDGTAAAGNPFGNRVYSYGHRNPQGLAWHPVTGELWSTEHGPSSTPPYCCNDEVNKIVAGGNYGWPRYYGTTKEDTNYSYFNIAGSNIKPVWISGTSGAAGSKWAPGGAMFYSGGPLGSPWTNSLIFAGLGGIDKSNQALFRLRLSADGKSPAQLDTLYKSTYGRIRDVVQGPDGAIYFTTSNKDGRGTAQSGDDKIIRLKPTGLPTTPSPAPTPTPAPAPTPTPPPSSGQTPYGAIRTIPAKLEAEDYDNGGQNIAFNDTTSTNITAKYRPNEAVDIEPCGEGGFNVGYNEIGEWREHTINTKAGIYSITARVATKVAGGQLRISLDGQTLGTLNVPNTGNWQGYQSVSLNNVNIPAGNNKVLKLETLGNTYTINWVEFTQTGSAPTTPATPTPPSAPGSASPTTPRPPIVVPGANPATPVTIPSDLPIQSDGTLIADFTGDGINEIVRDINNDGSIDPLTEVIGIDDSAAPTEGEMAVSIADQPSSGTVAVKLGPLPEAQIPKPLAYTFVVAQGIVLSGLGTYLAVTKLAIFASFRGRLGL